ncbi:carbamoyl-phosphate synthase subunit L [uncultured Oscillibacter sp.]|uniref:carbamoyl-phosphate synthase subunit L n=1 Tax=uncultured Oscillibacter sp. TaxID=876091 RepID=UPI0025F56976|nr:carbamoyl-phosphate synthase subunit L [uncultured Oscillibacter sp.]
MQELQRMMKDVVKRTVAEEYPHAKLPAVVYASVSKVERLNAYEITELVIHNDERHDSYYRGHIVAYWYGYELTVLDRFGDPDADYPPIPQIRSKKQFRQGAVVAVALPYGELTPSIIGEVRL